MPSFINLNRSRILSFIVTISALVLTVGCARSHSEKGEGDRKIIAKINKYELTAADFLDETHLTAPNKYISADPDRLKEWLLEELITKKVLLEEAQRQNFDKDKAFMKEIERYWEQALLKLLIRKKTEELARTIVVNDDELKEEYDRMLKEEGPRIGSFERLAPEIKKDIRQRKTEDGFDRWVAGLKSESHIKIYKDALKETELK